NNLLATGSYSLGMQCLAPASPPPTALTCGSLIPAGIGTAGEADFYGLSAAANDVVTFTLAQTSGFTNAVARAQLFDAAGNTVGTTFDANSSRQVTLPTAGTYLLRIAANNLVATGS